MTAFQFDLDKESRRVILCITTRIISCTTDQCQCPGSCCMARRIQWKSADSGDLPRPRQVLVLFLAANPAGSRCLCDLSGPLPYSRRRSPTPAVQHGWQPDPCCTARFWSRLLLRRNRGRGCGLGALCSPESLSCPRAPPVAVYPAITGSAPPRRRTPRAIQITRTEVNTAWPRPSEWT